jgi:hypothetical protein
MIYLKTCFYNKEEFKFLKLNLIESYESIDKFLICEASHYHNGTYKGFIWDEYKNLLPKEYMDKVEYIKCEVGDYVKESIENDNYIHKNNEPVCRSFFQKKINILDEDIIISVDADEIIYKSMYSKILEEVNNRGIVRLNLNLFFYKMNYYWKNKDFIAPIAFKWKYGKKQFPSDYRYGNSYLLPYKVGNHYSWVCSVEAMMKKLSVYCHSTQYRHCMVEEILEKAIKNKEYPFDKKVKFEIEIKNINDKIFNKTLLLIENDFKDYIEYI